MRKVDRDQDLSQQIAVLDRMKQEIALIQDPGEAKDRRDKAEALRTYAKAAGVTLEMQNLCAEVRLRYERRAGELLIEHGLQSGNPLWSHDATIGKKQSLSECTIRRHIGEICVS